MDDLTTYLRSPAAETDARAILNGQGASGSLQHGLTYGRAGLWEMVRPDRAAEVAVCWLATGATFTVSDLGVWPARPPPADREPDSPGRPVAEPRPRAMAARGGCPGCDPRRGRLGDALVVRNVSTEALPRTLCAVLLAPHMLGQL